MIFTEYAKAHASELKLCDCGAEYSHPRTCSKTISWDKVFQDWRHSGVTMEEAGIYVPDFERKARIYLYACSACKGPFHPATGHQWSENCRLCNGCTRDFIKWIKHREANMGHVRKGQTESFTDAALRSIKP